MSIGARFLEIRKAKGLKQTDVAEAIGISHGALVNYEKGREPPASGDPRLQPGLWRQRKLA
jgi:transcriptional regulator with XRE-family HTH domain